MVTVLSDDRRSTACYIVSEAANPTRSRDQIVIASGVGKLKPGTVLAKLTAGGQYKQLAPAAADGTQTAIAILYEGCDATSATVRRTVTARDAEIQADMLIWPAGITDTQKNAALASLAGLGIVAR